MDKKLAGLMDFIALSNEVRTITRTMFVQDSERLENDAEHCFQIALVAMYIIEANQLPLDVYKAMAIGLVHDLLEIYSGDTYVYDKGAALASKAEREHKALSLLKERCAAVPRLGTLIDEYEARQSAESKLVYALDKLVPIFNNYLDSGRMWKREKIDLVQLRAVKAGKVDIDPTIKEYYAAMVTMLEGRPDLFVQPA